MACSVFAELNASADRVATKVKGGGGGSGSSSTVGYAALQGEGAAVGVDAESGGDCRASKSGPTHETSVIEKNADVSKTSSIYGNAEAEAGRGCSRCNHDWMWWLIARLPLPQPSTCW